MQIPIQISLVGDHDPKVPAHRAIPLALTMAAESLRFEVRFDWINTDGLGPNIKSKLSTYDGVWCVPGSPYTDMDGALRAIQFAREANRPFLGTCGGFQHAIIEYARHVLLLPAADHEESNPAAEMLVISRLACSLVEARATITLQPDSRLAKIYGKTSVEEEFNCNFGVSPKFKSLLNNQLLKVSGWGGAGEPRAVELTSHMFFLATLFQPERSALGGKTHPLIKAFVEAASMRCR